MRTSTFHAICVGHLLATSLLAASARGESGPARICYSVQPNPYLNDHARDVKPLYDGFFFTIGSWEKTAQRFLGENGAAPPALAPIAQSRQGREPCHACHPPQLS
ncbi:MAG: hypothetical protein HY721_12895 [Planctomycetes bacterium]|nr:hypothetical protein [Planctomycetota bacterium]